MKNANQPAHPTLLYNRTSGETNGHELGLTKREIFAMAAMQGLNSAFSNTATFPPNLENIQYIVAMAVTQADELLKHLSYEE